MRQWIKQQVKCYLRRFAKWEVCSREVVEDASTGVWVDGVGVSHSIVATTRELRFRWHGTINIKYDTKADCTMELDCPPEAGAVVVCRTESTFDGLDELCHDLGRKNDD